MLWSLTLTGVAGALASGWIVVTAVFEVASESRHRDHR